MGGNKQSDAGVSRGDFLKRGATLGVGMERGAARTGQSRRAPQGRGLWRPWVQGRSGLRGYLKASASQQLG